MPKLKINGQIGPNTNSFFYRFFGIDYTCPRDVERAIEEANGELLDVYINSNGGEIGAGSEIYSLLREYGNIAIHITGAAHSAASIIAMAGRSEMSPTALMMVHCVSMSYVSGNHSVMEHNAEVLRAADQALCSAYVSKTGMSEEDALAMMEHETWFTAEQALERGLIDAIMFQEPEGIMSNVATGSYTEPTEEQLASVREFMAKGYKTIDDVNASEPACADHVSEIDKAKANIELIELTARKNNTIG